MNRALAAAVLGAALCVVVVMLVQEPSAVLLEAESDLTVPEHTTAALQDGDNYIPGVAELLQSGKKDRELTAEEENDIAQNRGNWVVVDREMEDAKAALSEMDDGASKRAFKREIKHAKKDCETYKLKDHYVCKQLFCSFQIFCHENDGGRRTIDKQCDTFKGTDSLMAIPSNVTGYHACPPATYPESPHDPADGHTPMGQCKCEKAKNWAYDKCEYMVKHVDRACLARYQKLETYVAKEKGTKKEEIEKEVAKKAGKEQKDKAKQKEKKQKKQEKKAEKDKAIEKKHKDDAKEQEKEVDKKQKAARANEKHVKKKAKQAFKNDEKKEKKKTEETEKAAEKSKKQELHTKEKLKKTLKKKERGDKKAAKKKKEEERKKAEKEHKATEKKLKKEDKQQLKEDKKEAKEAHKKEAAAKAMERLKAKEAKMKDSEKDRDKDEKEEKAAIKRAEEDAAAIKVADEADVAGAEDAGSTPEDEPSCADLAADADIAAADCGVVKTTTPDQADVAATPKQEPGTEHTAESTRKESSDEVAEGVKNLDMLDDDVAGIDDPIVDDDLDTPIATAM